jgi:protein gp37
MKDSKIEWTDHSFNPWIGCTRVSPGCQHCYAETMMADRYKKVKWGPQGVRVRTSTDYWKQPARWNRQAAADGVRRRVFCASLADVFEDKADQREDMDEWRLGLWNLILATPYLDWLLLTKRPENVDAMIPRGSMRQRYPANVWIGTSVEDQRRADERIPHLLAIPAAVRFLSVEPLLGPVDLSPWFGLAEGYEWRDCLCDEIDPSDQPCLTCEGRLVLGQGSGIHWVIVGGESGPNARPMHPTWARSLRDQCQAAGVPFFFKQWGEYGPCTEIPGQAADPDCMFRFGKKLAGRLLDGREWNEFPNDDGGAR